MKTDQVIANFLAKVKDPGDKETLKTLGLARRELDLFLAALNTLEDGSLEIPGLNATAGMLNISTPYIQTLKNKSFIQAGKKRGDWIVTSKAVDLMRNFLGLKESEADLPKNTPKMSGAKKASKRKLKKTSKKVTTKPKTTKSRIDISAMSIGEIREELKRIEGGIAHLTNDREEIMKQAKTQLGFLLK